MRLFYALMPSDATMAALRPMMEGVAGARWQSTAQLHLTLRFIGEVQDRDLLDHLVTAMGHGSIDMAPLALDGVGYFETRARPNSLWVRASPVAPIAALHRKLDRACQSAGLAPERRAYVPHITLARLPRSAGPIRAWIERHAAFSCAPAVFTRVSLVESISTADGSHYEEVASVPMEVPIG